MQEDRFFLSTCTKLPKRRSCWEKNNKKYNCLTDFDIQKMINTNASTII
jgi:hypothetical protein